jgi:hypothetical protein
LRALGQSIFSIKYKPKLYQYSKLSDDNNDPTLVRSINFDKNESLDSVPPTWNQNLHESVTSITEQKDLCLTPTHIPNKNGTSRISFVPKAASRFEKYRGVIKTKIQNNEEQYLVEELESPVKLPTKRRFENFKPVELNEERKIGDHLFEDFFIVGSAKQDMFSLMQSKAKSGNLEARILANWPNEIDSDKWLVQDCYSDRFIYA